MRIRVLFFNILAIFFVSRFAFANVSPEAVLNNRQYITPEIIEEVSTKPEKFYHTNNLRRMVGSPFLAKGEYLFIEGYLTDLLGNPIESAKIYIWQPNVFGYYNHLIRHTEDDLKYDLDFAGTGTFVTDNLGHYEFTTIMPGYYGDHAPHINFLIKHDLFHEDYQTVMYFPGHPHNLEDEVFTSLNEIKRNAITSKIILINKDNPGDGKYALFNLRLDWIHPYKTK